MLESILSSLFSAGMLLSSFVIPGEGATDYSRYTNNGSKPISLARENTTNVSDVKDAINVTDAVNATDVINTINIVNTTNIAYPTLLLNASNLIDTNSIVDTASALNTTALIPIDEVVTLTCATSNSLWQPWAEFVSANALSIGVGTAVVAVMTYLVYSKLRGPSQWPANTPGMQSNEVPPNVLVGLIQQAARQVKLKVHSNSNLPGHMPGWAQTSPAKKTAFIEALRQLVANYLGNAQRQGSN